MNNAATIKTTRIIEQSTDGLALAARRVVEDTKELCWADALDRDLAIAEAEIAAARRLLHEWREGIDAPENKDHNVLCAIFRQISSLAETRETLAG